MKSYPEGELEWKPSSSRSFTEAGARAEGFANRAAFIETWQRMHGQFEDDTEVWVIKFRLAETAGEIQ